MQKILIFSQVMVLFLALSAGAQEVPQYVFQIPEYSGMEVFNSNSSLNLLQPPFGTVMRVYRTNDNSPLDKEKVITFFEDALTKKGWIKGIFERKGDEPYLSLRTQVYQNLKDGTSVHAAGDFYLWIAPKDGMFTVLMRQWRISSPGQQPRLQVTKIIEALEGTDKAITYPHVTMKVQSDSEWEKDYENEYLVGRELFTIVDKRFLNVSHIAPKGLISISILIYKDAETAKAEMNRRKTYNLPSLSLVSLGNSHEAIITLENILVIVKDHSSKEQKKVDNIAKRLQELVH